jgi:uncharacterized membrane protein (UPF0127 family)
MRLIRWKGHSPLHVASVAAAIIVALIVAVIWMTVDRRNRPTVLIETPNGVVLVELANTPAARSAGLSNRQRLEDIEGLLLKWDTPGRHPIWMADMRFPLDLAWIDAGGRVLAVLANVPPCHERPCSLYEPDGTDRSVAVLELTAGAAASRAIRVGTNLNISTR